MCTLHRDSFRWLNFGLPVGRIPSWVARWAKFAPIAASAVTAAVLEPVPHHLHGAMLESVYTAMETLRGILIPGFVDRDRQQAQRRWETATSALRRMPHPDLAPVAGPAKIITSP